MENKNVLNAFALIYL